jgi:hypothetical protein
MKSAEDQGARASSRRITRPTRFRVNGPRGYPLMIVWLWDGYGTPEVLMAPMKTMPGPARPREAFIRSGRASSATVERARLVLGIRSLYSGYARLGRGWRTVPCQVR